MTDRRRGRRSAAAHWDDVYARSTPAGVSWYQTEASTSVALIEDLALPHDAPLLDIGGGASTLVDALVARGYSDTTVLDVSEVALAAARARLGVTPAVRWIREDLLTWRPTRSYAVWHDRAVFHFLVDPGERRAYRTALRAVVGDGSHVIIGTFALDGPSRCSGLPVARYDDESLARELGPEFIIVGVRRTVHVTPAGVVQPFTWIVGRRTAHDA